MLLRSPFLKFKPQGPLPLHFFFNQWMHAWICLKSCHLVSYYLQNFLDGSLLRHWNLIDHFRTIKFNSCWRLDEFSPSFFWQKKIFISPYITTAMIVYYKLSFLFFWKKNNIFQFYLLKINKIRDLHIWAHLRLNQERLRLASFSLFLLSDCITLHHYISS